MFALSKTNTEFEIQGFHSIYYFEFGKNFTHAPEKHDFWEMVYVDSGKIIAVTDGIDIPLLQGQMIFHQPNELHSHISDKNIPNNMIVISFTCKSRAMDFFSKKVFTLDKTSKQLLTMFIQEAKNALGKVPGDYELKNDLDFSKEQFGATQLLCCYLTEFLILLTRGGKEVYNNILPIEEKRIIDKNSITEMIIAYMNDNLYNSLTLGDICAHFIIGKSQLCHMFKENTGISVMGYYNSLKTKEAKRLLREDKYSVSDISDKLGYSCIHAFSRSFKNEVGVSPTAYKKRLIY